ncbi:MAG: hypothetical protein QW222_08070 [Candidatus Bathyarchaeia archaeon]
MSDKKSLKRLREELIRFENAMEELHFLKLVTEDLKSFKRMIRLKRYD